MQVRRPLQKKDVAAVFFGTRAGCVLLVLLLMVPGFAPAADSAEQYWLLEEYLDRYPAQRALLQQFSREVAAPGQSRDKPVERAVRVAVVYPGNQVSDYWRRSVQAFEARMQELFLPYRLESFFSRPGANPELQEQQIVDALATDPDYLVFTLDASRHQRIIEHIIARGRPKLILQNITTPVRAWDARQPFFYVGFDHVEGSELLADAVLGSATPPREAAILYWAPGYVSSMRGDTFLRRLQQANVIIRDRFYTRADRSSARTAARAALRQNPDLDFIFSCATDVAFGVLDAIQEDSRNQRVVTNGWGGGSQELDAILAGRLQLTVMRINDDNGVAMAEAIRRDLSGQPVPQVYAGRLALVTRDTPAHEIEALKRQAFRYSGLQQQ